VRARSLAIAVLATVALVAATPAPGAPPTAARGTLVSYSRSGAIAGLRETLVVTRAGRATAQGARGFSGRPLKAQTMRRLRRLLAAARFDLVPRVTDMCGDCFRHTVVYAGRRTSFFDGAKVPASVRAAVDELQRIAGGGR
jgi:hypothetical protein